MRAVNLWQKLFACLIIDFEQAGIMSPQVAACVIV